MAGPHAAMPDMPGYEQVGFFFRADTHFQPGTWERQSQTEPSNFKHVSQAILLHVHPCLRCEAGHTCCIQLVMLYEHVLHLKTQSPLHKSIVVGATSGVVISVCPGWANMHLD